MIYFAESVGVGHIKIGYTDRDDVEERLDDLRTGCPVPIRLLGTMPGDECVEKDLHRRFAAAQVHREWFQPVPELLALINAPQALACGDTSVVLKSVQIRVLTVGRKQFSKALLGQLTYGNPFRQIQPAPGRLLPQIESGSLRLQFRDDCDYWGWLQNEFKVLVYQQQDCLKLFSTATMRHERQFTLPQSLMGMFSLSSDPDAKQAEGTVWRAFCAEWITPQHQLFIGL